MILVQLFDKYNEPYSKEQFIVGVCRLIGLDAPEVIVMQLVVHGYFIFKFQDL